MADNLEAVLGKVLSVAMPLVQVSEISKSFKDKPTDYKILKPYTELFVPPTGNEEVDKAMREKAYDDLVKASPANVCRLMDDKIGELEARTTSAVAESPDSLISNLPEAYLMSIAMAVSGKEKQMKDAQEAIDKGEVDKARKMYVETAGKYDKCWARFLKDVASKEFIIAFAPVFFQREHDNFLGQFVKKGSKTPSLDGSKIRGYISEKLLSAKEDKERNKYYLEIGKAMGKYQMAAMQQEAQSQRAVA